MRDPRVSFVRQVTYLSERTVRLVGKPQPGPWPLPLSQISPGEMVCDAENYIIYINTKYLYTQIILAHTAITKYHRLGGLNNRSLFSYSFGAWKSKISFASMAGFW